MDSIVYASKDVVSYDVAVSLFNTLPHRDVRAIQELLVHPLETALDWLHFWKVHADFREAAVEALCGESREYFRDDIFGDAHRKIVEEEPELLECVSPRCGFLYLPWTEESWLPKAVCTNKRKELRELLQGQWDQLCPHEVQHAIAEYIVSGDAERHIDVSQGVVNHILRAGVARGIRIEGESSKGIWLIHPDELEAYRTGPTYRNPGARLK